MLIVSIIYRLNHKPKIKVDKESLEVILPCAERFIKKKGYWIGLRKGTTCGFAFLTPHIPPKVKGYAGEIWLLAGMNVDGEITGIEVLSHNETPFYFEMLEEGRLFQDLKRHNLKEGFKGLKAVSGATISSRAVINDVIKGGAYIAEKELGIKINLYEKRNWKNIFYGILIFIIFVIASISVILHKRVLTYISFTFSFFLFGVLLNNVFSLSDVAKVLLFQFPSSENLPLFLLYLMVIITSFIPRPAYCWGICPYGALQELASRTGRKIKVKNGKTASIVKIIRDTLALLLLSLFYITGISGFVSFEPFHWMFSGNASAIMWLFALLGILFSFFIYRFWCVFLCPTGAILEFVSEIFNRLHVLLSPPKRSS